MESESSPGLFLRFFCGKGALRSKDAICEMAMETALFG